jgi:hypothetical protein
MAQLINTFVRTVDLDVIDTDLSYKRVYFVYKNDLDSFSHGMTNHKGASNDIHTLLQDLDDGCCTIHFDLALALAARDDYSSNLHNNDYGDKQVDMLVADININTLFSAVAVSGNTSDTVSG